MKRTREKIENLEQQLQYIHTIRAALFQALGTKTSVHVARSKGRKEIVPAEQLLDLQIQMNELKYVLSGLTEKVKPYGASYAMEALGSGFTARDEKALQAFWHKMSLMDQSTLTRERMNAEFDATMHEFLKGGMERVLRSHYKDGQHVDLYRAVFGDVEPPEPEDFNEDDESSSSDVTP